MKVTVGKTKIETVQSETRETDCIKAENKIHAVREEEDGLHGKQK